MAGLLGHGGAHLLHHRAALLRHHLQKNIIKMGRLTAIVRYESNAPLLLFRRETFEEPGHLEKDQRGRLHP